MIMIIIIITEYSLFIYKNENSYYIIWYNTTT